MIENFLKDGMIFEESNWIWFLLVMILVIFIQSEMKSSVKELGIEEVLNDSLFDEAATKFGLHAMGEPLKNGL